MSSPDFAAAQARLQARRQAREAAERARLSAEREARNATLSRLPGPFGRLGSAGLRLWDSIKGREGTRPVFRVGQVDAELLDEELLELLRGQVGEALKYWGSHLTTDYGPEILLALRAILFKLTIWDHNASYGASLQGLRYTNAQAKYPSNLSRPPPKPWQKSIYGLVTVFGRYGWTKWESYLLDQESGYEEPTPVLKRLSRITSFLTSTHDVAAFISFLIFLFNGRYRTLLDRILRLRLAPTSSQVSREVSFEYLNRQLVWHAFTEFLLFILPLVGISRWRRILSRLWRRAKLSFKRLGSSASSADEDDEVLTKGQGELHFLPERTCAICYSDQNPTSGASEAEILASSGSGGVIGSAQTDVTNPYEAIPCGCIYCFVCLAQRIEAEEGEGWTCLRCGEVVKECKPWNGDVVEEVAQSRPGTAKSVGFADDGDEKHSQGMRSVDPMPMESDVEASVQGNVEGLAESGTMRQSGWDESGEWARATEVDGYDDQGTEHDDQSEEYEEEEADFDNEGSVGGMSDME